MSKRKVENAYRNDVFASWRHDENYKCKTEDSRKAKSFVAIPHTLLMNNNFQRLSPSAKELYIYMMDYANSLKEFEFPHSIYIKLMSNQGFINSRKQLFEHGFIEEIANGRFTREANKYMFSTKWKKIEIKEKEKKHKFKNNK